MAPGHNSRHLLSLLTQPVVHEIIEALAAGEADVTTLAQRLELDQPAVSRALARLRAEDIVSFQRKWRRHIYRLTERVRIEAGASEAIEITTVAGERIVLSRP